MSPAHRLLRRVFDAALDQPQPTPALREALNLYLSITGHKLAPKEVSDAG